jgi:hypothetical protein
MSDDVLNNLPNVPDFLADLLEDDEIVEVFASEANDHVRLPYIKIPQFSPQATDYTVFGKILLMPLDKDADPVMADSVDLMLVDQLTFTFRNLINGKTTPRHFPQHILNDSQYKSFVSLGKEGVGARTMWRVKPDGNRDMTSNVPECASPNGIAPRRSFIGKQILDPRRSEMITIGQMVVEDALGEQVVVESKYPCLTCPLSRFMKDANGKNLAPPCGHTPVWIVYNINDGQLYSLQGSNRGLLQSLLGVPEPKLTGDKKDFAYGDDAPAMGLEYFFAPAVSNKYAAKELERLLGAKPEPTSSLSRPFGMPRAATTEELAQRPVYPVRMTITLSNYPNATLVPQFSLMAGEYTVLSFGDVAKKLKNAGKPTFEERVRVQNQITNAPLTPEQLAGWLAARKQYHDESMREHLMSLADLPNGISVGAVTPEMLTGGGHAALPAVAGLPSTPPWSEADIVEG